MADVSDRDVLHRARAELEQLELAYQGALDRGMSEESREGIANAFDEADRLQRRLLAAVRRLRGLASERERTNSVGPAAAVPV
jgi:hypothetical protein